MKIIIFGGLTVNEKEVKDILNGARYMPPAKHADVISAVQNYNPDVIGIIDGVIHSELSVWHKEILFALDKGIRVYGAGGMGAIRAAELHNFGMTGIGKVFDFYKNGEIEDDDEVFVKFERQNGRFVCLSEPMVNLRATFKQALSKKIIDASAYERFVKIAKSLHYTERSFGEVYRVAIEEGLSDIVIEKMKCFSGQFRVNITKQDALEMLMEIARLSPGDLFAGKKGTPDYSMLFAPLYERERLVRCNNLEFPIYYIGNYLCLYHPDAEDLNYNGLNRELALYLAHILQIEVEEKEIENEITRFRKKHRLEEKEEFEKWVRENDLPDRDFRTLFKKQALLRKMHYWFFTSRRQFVKNTSYLLEELKLANTYVEWKEAAAKREEAAQENNSEFKESFLKEDFVTLLQEYLHNHKLPWSLNIKEAAEEMGMKKKDIKIELVKDRLYRKKILAEAIGLFND